MKINLHAQKLCFYLSFILALNFQAQNKKNTAIDTKAQLNHQESVFSHINKSTYIKGEEIGFTSYVFNKKTKKLSPLTKNLYCVISDEENNVLKSKLLKVENGIANGSFVIDSLFTTGTYTVKTFTNWMLNFKSHNYHLEKIRIIDSRFIKANKNIVKQDEIDIQYLPESGTLLKNTVNTIGVIAKNNLGFGLKNITGEIFEDNKKIIDFTLNDLGIGRFSFTPKQNSIYKAIVNYNNKSIQSNILENIKEEGILLKVSKTQKEAFISVVTNKNTISKVKNQPFYLLFNNENNENKIKVKFKGKTSITNRVLLKNFPTGINTVSLVNHNNKPIAERIFFNYENLNLFNTKQTSTKKTEKDSIEITLKIDALKNYKKGNVSISILPKKTRSYYKGSNIISQTLLQPHLNSVVENGSYYFKHINNKRKYDLDNLLITQGWSSYDWNLMNIKNNTNIHKFENGISIKVNVSDIEKESSYLVHHLSHNDGSIIDFKEEIKSFQLYSYYPENNENLYISQIGKKNKLKQPSLYIQYYPNHVPELNTSIKTLNSKAYYNNDEILNTSYKFYNLKKVEVLKEIVVKANLKQQRIDKIKNEAWGKVTFLSEMDRNSTLAQYLNFKPGIEAYDDYRSGTLVAINTAQNQNFNFFLDGFEVVNPGHRLYNFGLFDVEYIEINKQGFGSGLVNSRAGAISIKTNPLLNTVNKKTVRKFEFPITFSTQKKFYVPKYKNYTSSFYKNYGVINWLPINSINENGEIKVKIKNHKQNNIKMFIEGVTGNGEFISEEVNVKIK